MVKAKFSSYNADCAKDQYNEFYKTSDFIRFPLSEQNIVRSLIKEYGIEKGAKLLDIGCGTGRYTHLFTENGIDATGVDISEQAIKTAKEKYPASDFLVHDITQYDIRKNTTDVIFCSGLSLFNEKNLDCLLPFVEKLFLSLKKDGLFIFAKTSSLTDKRSKSGSRFDHSLHTFVSFFKKIDDGRIIDSCATYPHVFIIFKRFALSKIITTLSVIITKLTNIPLRVYIILRKN